MTQVDVTIVNEEETYFLRYQVCAHHRQMSAALVFDFIAQGKNNAV